MLPVGGIKEKLLAAHRAGIREVLVPARNERDLDDIPKDIRGELKMHLIKRVDEVLPLVLEPPIACRRCRSRTASRARSSEGYAVGARREGGIERRCGSCGRSPVPGGSRRSSSSSCSAAVGFLPLFGGPGYEQSLASGLVVPMAAAIATAIELSASDGARAARVRRRGASRRARSSRRSRSRRRCCTALRVGICDFWGGAVFFLLTAGVGAHDGRRLGRRRRARSCRGRRRRRLLCVLLALAGPLGGIVVSVARFYGSPMIFAYDPFFGYFSGTLYDTVVDVRPELWTYRGGSVATLVGLALVAAAFDAGSATDGSSFAPPARRDARSAERALVHGRRGRRCSP